MTLYARSLTAALSFLAGSLVTLASVHGGEVLVRVLAWQGERG